MLRQPRGFALQIRAKNPSVDIEEAVQKFKSQSTDLAEEHDLYDNKVHLQDVMKAIVAQVRCPREAAGCGATGVISPPLALALLPPLSLKTRQGSRELLALCRARRSNR